MFCRRTRAALVHQSMGFRRVPSQGLARAFTRIRSSGMGGSGSFRCGIVYILWVLTMKGQSQNAATGQSGRSDHWGWAVTDLELAFGRPGHKE